MSNQNQQSVSSTTNSTRWYENFPAVCGTIAAVSIVTLGIHWALETHAPPTVGHSLPNFILKEIGLAGLIALILNLSIEWVNRKRHIDHQDQLLKELELKHQRTSEKLLEDVNEQLFRTIYKRNIDPAVFLQVEDRLLKAPMMRRGFVASFKIKKFKTGCITEPSKFVQLDLVHRYRVFNLTDKPTSLTVAKAIVDVAPAYKEHCFFKRVKLGEEIFDRQMLLDNDFVKQVKDRNFIALNIDRIVTPQDSLLVEIEYSKLAPLDFSEVIVSTVPMDGLTLEVSDPEELFSVEAASLHPESEILLTPADQRHLLQWKIEQAILPGQGIVMMWHPTDNTTPSMPTKS